MKYQEIKGDLISFSKEGIFDVIVHGCNCFCTQGKGLAKQMVEVYQTDTFPMEQKFRGNINKLGTIDFESFTDTGEVIRKSTVDDLKDKDVLVIVVNAYTQYRYDRIKPVDYDAITLCLKKINFIFKGKHIGLPKIGCGLAGGDWSIVKDIILTELKDCDVSVIEYVKS